MTTILYRLCLFLAALGFAAGADWNSNCPTSMKPCNNGNCLPEQWFCDGDEDCPDGEDETSPRCPTAGVADNWAQSPSIYDSRNLWGVPNAPIQCPPNLLLCSRTCVDESIRCNGFRDCDNFDDEWNCFQPAVIQPAPVNDYLPTTSATISQCGEGEVQCFKGNCISADKICDGKNDCIHGEDEFACAFSSNKKFTYKCIEKCVGLPKNCTAQSDDVKAPTFPTIAPTTRAPRRLCDSGFQVVGDYCLKVSIFPPKTWKQAVESCSSINTQLLEILSGDYFLELQNFLNQSSYTAYSFWTGANDIQVDGNWIWNDSRLETHVGTPLWSIAREGNSYEQQPTGGSEQNCGLLENCPFRYMNDEDCEREYPFICQKPATIRSW